MHACSLLSALAPVVMGTIARQQGVNAGSIANLFASQKDNIADALPSGFDKMLSGTGLLDTVGDAARRTVGAGTEATRAAAASVSRTIDDTRRGVAETPSTNWLLWAIPALAIAALLFWLLAKPTEQVVQQGVTTAQSLMVGGIDLGKQVTDSLNSLRTTLTSVTDPASAQAALPKLREATAQLDKASGMLGQLSDTQRKVLAGTLSRYPCRPRSAAHSGWRCSRSNPTGVAEGHSGRAYQACHHRRRTHSDSHARRASRAYPESDAQRARRNDPFRSAGAAWRHPRTNLA